MSILKKKNIDVNSFFHKRFLNVFRHQKESDGIVEMILFFWVVFRSNNVINGFLSFDKSKDGGCDNIMERIDRN